MRGRGSGSPGVGRARAVLASLYASHFAHMGVVLPFLPPWIRSRGYGPLAIAILLALGPAAKVAAFATWGRWADRSGRRRELLAAASLLAAAALALLAVPGGFSWILLLVGAYSFAVAPGIPFVEATALERAEALRFDYGSVRLWGSLAFVVVSVAYGAAQDRASDAWGFAVAAAMLAVTAPLAAALPPAHASPEPARGGGGGTGGPAQARRGPLVRLLLACALMQAAHGPYYAFYSIRLQDLGYGGFAIGSFWAFAVISEVLMLAFADRIARRVGDRAVLQASLAAGALRWLVIAFASAPVPLAFAQVLHAMTYGSFHVASLREVYRAFPRSERATGQALFSGITYGAGIFAGTLAAGAVAETVGLPPLFAGSAALCLLAMGVLGRGRTARG